MRDGRCRWAWISAIGLLAACTASDTAGPVAVPPADDEVATSTSGDAATPDVARPSDVQAETLARAEDVGDPRRSDTTGRPQLPGADEITGGGVWVVDSAGQPVGALVRRGSDDNLVYRAIYDLVTVYHPESGLFFEVTMSDAVVRRPSTTFYSTADCQNPIGISYGGCSDCRSGPGTALLHDDTWYRVTPGVTFQVTTAGSTRGSGLQDACSSHHTDSAKIFPVTAVSGPSPPTVFTAPLHFAWR